MTMVQCPECDGAFEPAYDSELLCWMCELYLEYNHQAQYGILESQQDEHRFRAGSDDLDVYWGIEHPFYPHYPDDIPF